MDHVTHTTPPSEAAPRPHGPDLTGRTLGDFHILRRLGQGGMGQVYLAEQISLKRRVALKLLRPDLAADATSLQRFRLEAEAVARATHANIVQVYAIDQAEGLHYMALEYVEGRNLKEYLAKKGPPSALQAVGLMRQVASALQRAAELGIVHRDIKPENILLTRKGEVKVADFGLARCLAPDTQPLNLTQSGQTLGTPLYMSPEQVEGKPLDPRSDIYSFGVTCYHMLAGHPPFRGTSAFEVALQHVRDEPTPLQSVRPDLPPGLCAVVHKMMAKKPEERYPTGRELLRDLTRVREGLAGSTAGAISLPSATLSPLPAARPPRRRPYWLFVGSLLLALGAGAGLGWLRIHAHAQAPAPEEPAGEAEADDGLFSQRKREQFLKEAVQHYANPGNDPSKIDLGLSHAAELGGFYLDQGRLDEADQFFLAESGQQTAEYAVLGKLGHATVLALRNQPAESNKAFLELLGDKKRFGDPRWRRQFLGKNPQLHQLHQWVAKALDYNAANAAESPFPRELEPLRRPFPRRGQEKGVGKGV